jgi:hypothetical protein
LGCFATDIILIDVLTKVLTEVLIETIALDGIRQGTKHGLRTARKGARSPIVARYSPRRSRYATSRFHPPGSGGGLLGVLYEKISDALAPLGNSGC